MPVKSLASVYDGKLALVWVDGTNGTDADVDPSPQAVMARVTRGFSGAQRAGVVQLARAADVPGACPQNFNLFSECFAAVVFDAGEGGGGTVNYTLRADAGLFHIDVTKHTSDYEERLLPLQWAIDSVRGCFWMMAYALKSAHTGSHRTPDGHGTSNASGVAIHAGDQRRAIYGHPSQCVCSSPSSFAVAHEHV